jgi:hydroxymethylbilane synthase
MKLVFATRPSALARWQTGWIMEALQAAHPDLECVQKIITTQGDRVLDKPLPEIGGKGLFTQELEVELLCGAVHCAVHSLKDLPVEDTPGLTIGCVPARAEVRDALVSKQGYTLQTLPPAAVVGTSSLRRAAQALLARPDLIVVSLRGNVDTRLRKALEGQYDAILLAGAGLLRLGLESHITEWLSLEAMLPAPGQGALAVQCREKDGRTLALLAALEHAPSRLAVTAERQFLLTLGGGCSLPVAAYAAVDKQATIQLTGLVAAPDGTRTILVKDQGTDPRQLGDSLARAAIAQGANEILAHVAESRKS